MPAVLFLAGSLAKRFALYTLIFIIKSITRSLIIFKMIKLLVILFIIKLYARNNIFKHTLIFLLSHKHAPGIFGISDSSL